MDLPTDHPSSLNVELRLVKFRNICVHTSRQVFVRCYLPTEGNKRVRIDSQEIPTNPPFSWNQTFSLTCVGAEETIQSMKQGNIVFELRCRSSAPVLARISGSKLLARAEIPWNDVVGKPDMEIEKWVVMIPKNKHVYSDDVKPPAIQIAMKVEQVKKARGRRCDDYDCDCNSCIDYDFFALEAF